MACLIPAGKLFDNWSMVSMMLCAVASAFEPGRWKIPSATAGSRSRYELLEPSWRLHRDLKRPLLGYRGLIEHAGGDLDILALQRLHDVGRGQADRLQAVGIDPDAHRIVAAAEDGDRAHPVDAGQNVGDRERRIV